MGKDQPGKRDGKGDEIKMVTEDQCDHYSMFPEGPDLSPPDEETLKREGLFVSTWSSKDGDYEVPLSPVVCMSPVVWAMANSPDAPVYALFNRGTNSLVILERKGRGAAWRKIEDVKEIEDLYGFMWKMIIRMERLQQQRDSMVLAWKELSDTPVTDTRFISRLGYIERVVENIELSDEVLPG